MLQGDHRAFEVAVGRMYLVMVPGPLPCCKDCVVVPKSKKLLLFALDDGSGKERTIFSGIQEYYQPKN